MRAEVEAAVKRVMACLGVRSAQHPQGWVVTEIVRSDVSLRCLRNNAVQTCWVHADACMALLVVSAHPPAVRLPHGMSPRRSCKRSAQPCLIPYPVQVHADARMIQSVLYASKLSLRFPRVEAVRWDKSPVDIQTVAEVWDLVNRQKDGIGACSELIF